MKIYSKKKFTEGILLVSLGAANLILGITNHGLDAMDIIIMAASLIYGLDAFRQCLSEKLSRESKLEDLDERNQFIKLKADSRSFQITQAIFLALLIGFLLAAKLTADEEIPGICFGLFIAYAISGLINIFTVIYYKENN